MIRRIYGTAFAFLLSGIAHLIPTAMKKTIIISVLAILTFWAGIATARDYPDEYLGLPGDNLNLYATMKLFQESETLEAFERSLNDPNSHINNLDLNGDNLVDYISVVDYVDGDVHNIVLRTQLNRNETQDIAVFTVQRFDDGTARIQLIGDEALYGKNYIVEPIYADSQETPNPGYMGNTTVIATPAPVTVTTYQVAFWPIIRFIYRPGYVRWHSIWGWGHYPSYWNPWHTYYWHTYFGYHSHFDHYYYAHYRHWNHYRYHRYHNFYYSHVRAHSPKVSDRIRRGNYRTTYSRPDLKRKGDDLYRRTARRSTGYRTDNSNQRRTNNRQSVNNRRTYNTHSNSGRRTVSGTPSRTQANSSANRRSVDTRRSSTVRSGRSTANPYQGNRNGVSQRRSRSSSPNRTGTRSSVSTQRHAPQKTTINNSRSSRSSSVGRSYRQPSQSRATYSNRSSSKPKVSSRSSSSRSSYRKPKTSSRSSVSRSSSRQPRVSSRSHSSNNRSSSVTSRSSRSSSVKSSRSSSNRSSKATNKSNRSRSSSEKRSGRR